MPNIADLLEGRRRRTTRPEQYEELLLEPIIDGPGAATTPYGSYVGWERDHNVARRFYIAGVGWFKKATELTLSDVVYHRTKVERAIWEKTTWHLMSDPEHHWKKPLGRPQIRNAFNGEPMPFAKAAQVLMACEVALDDLFNNPREDRKIPSGFSSAEELHGYMAIFPACCNIDDLGDRYITEVRKVEPNVVAQLRDAAGQRSELPILDLSRGMTVSRGMAEDVHRHAVANYRVSIALGHVRGKPGKHLGNGNATSNEDLDLC